MASTTETEGRKAPSGTPRVSSLADFKRKKLTLDAYDRITHQTNRDREEKRAEVERKARETF